MQALPLSGCNLNRALRYARRCGCHIIRTGEVLVSHPCLPGERVRVNGRRKDAPRALTTFLKKLSPN